MIYLHISAILFFVIIILYSLFRYENSSSIIEGMDDISSTNVADLISIKKELDELNGIGNKVMILDTLSKSNTDEINALRTKMAEMTKK